jgi:transposase-like protein
MNALKILVWIVLWLTAAAAQAQELTLLTEVKVKQPVSISTDRNNHIFTSDPQGNIHKYDSTGKLLHVFSPQKVARATLIEAWPTMQIFLFYRDLQAYTYLNRFLTDNRQTTGFDTDMVGFARVATVASDELIWVFDEADFSLKKLNAQTQQLTVSVPLNLVLTSAKYNINYMREYQNMLFVNDANSGILVFDNFGNYKKKLPFSGLSFFGFRGNELYYVNESGIHFFDLYTLATKSLPLPGNISPEFVLVFNTRVAVFKKNSLFIYQLNVN